MDGYDYRNSKPFLPSPESAGIIPRAIDALFSQLPSSECTVYCSYVQIYNEKLYDLLNPAHMAKPGLKLRWKKNEEFYVENLYLHPCVTAQEVLDLFHAGLKNKIMAAHSLNTTSSRSHCILSLQVQTVRNNSVMNSKLSLVDLAGSERIGMTQIEGELMKESIDINKALFTLRQVIGALSAKDASYVPYRDSKLTSLLKQGIGGNSFCLMIACLCPSDTNYEENISTLKYATKAGRISNEPIKNVDPKTKLIDSLRWENKQLRNELESAQKQIKKLLAGNTDRKLPADNKFDVEKFLKNQYKNKSRSESCKPKEENTVDQREMALTQYETFHDKSENAEQVVVDRVVKRNVLSENQVSRRPISEDMNKQEAISALSKLLLDRAKTRKNS